MDLTTIKDKCKICGKNFKLIEVNSFDLKLKIPDCNCDLSHKKDDSKIEKLIDESCIPIKYRIDPMKDWINVKGTEKVINAVNKYIDELENNILCGIGIILVGKPGRGKTKISCYIGIEVIKKIQVNLYYLSLAKFFINIEIMNKDEINNLINRYCSCKALIIDDIGESKINDWHKKYLYTILDERNNNRKMTIINCMYCAKKMAEIIGEHNVSRMLEIACDNIIEINTDKDMRFYKNR